MTKHLSSDQVWKELKKELFAVLGMVTAKGEARTIGVVYIVHGQKIYISTGKESWKARHIRSNSNVSITVPIAKRIPLMPFIKIPAATITFPGIAKILSPENLEGNVPHELFRGLESDKEMLAETIVLEIEPKGEFVTYGIGIPLMQMRFPEKARGRASV